MKSRFNILYEQVMNSIEVITAYHISPYKFDKFDFKSVGSGMGTGFYGKGFYFTTDKDIIDYYYDQMKDSYDELYIYTVELNGNFISEFNDELVDKMNEIDAENQDEVQKVLDSMNVDGITYYSIEDGNSIVVFNDNCIEIKNIEKL